LSLKFTYKRPLLSSPFLSLLTFHLSPSTSSSFLHLSPFTFYLSSITTIKEQGNSTPKKRAQQQQQRKSKATAPPYEEERQKEPKGQEGFFSFGIFPL
jgi:hypothetical protein